MMFCPNCRKQIPDSSVFCNECGSRLYPESEQQGWGAQSSTAYPIQKRKPIGLYMGIAVLLVIVAAALFLVLWNAQANDPLHGAKLKRQTIWEANGLRVDATGLRYDDYNAFPYRIELEISNQSGRALTVQCDAAAVNGYAVDQLMSVDIPAGGSVTDALSISERSMWRAGIEMIGTVDMILSASDTDTHGNGFRSDVLTFQTNKKVSQKDQSVRGEVLCDQNGIRLSYVTYYPQYDDDNQALEFYVENKTGRTLAFRDGTTSAGGVEITDTWLSEIMTPDSKGYFCLQVNRNELDAAGQLPMRDVTTVFVFYNLGTEETLFELPVSFTVS